MATTKKKYPWKRQCALIVAVRMDKDEAEMFRRHLRARTEPASNSRAFIDLMKTVCGPEGGSSRDNLSVFKPKNSNDPESQIHPRPRLV